MCPFVSVQCIVSENHTNCNHLQVVCLLCPGCYVVFLSPTLFQDHGVHTFFPPCSPSEPDPSPTPCGLPCPGVTCIAGDPLQDAGQAGRGTTLPPVPLQHGDVLVLHVLRNDQVHQVSLMKLRDFREPQLLQHHFFEPFLGEGIGHDNQREHIEHPGEACLHPALLVARREERGCQRGCDALAGCGVGQRFYSQPHPTGTTNSTSGEEAGDLKGSPPPR